MYFLFASGAFPAVEDLQEHGNFLKENLKSRLARVVLIYCSLVAVLIFSAIEANGLLKTSSFPYMPDRRLFEFDRKLQEYKDSPPFHGRRVILGSSYAAELETSYMNLGLIATVPREHMYIIQECWPQDTVLYVFTLRDLFYTNTPVRGYVIRKPLRRLYLSKMGFLYWAHFYDRAEEKPGDYYEEYRLLMYASGRDSLKGLWADRTIQLIEELAAFDRIDLSLLRKLQELHPNIVFVLHPILPLKPLPEDRSFARQVNHLVRCQQQLLQKLKQSKLPVIDLSDQAQSQQFIDLLHVKPEAQLGRKLEHLVMDREARGR